jgi:hypothetical protein
LDVRTYLDSELLRQFEITTLPAFTFVSPHGRVVYKGPQTVNSLLGTANALLPSKVKVVDESWARRSTPSVILFTPFQTCPPIWAGISCAFHGIIPVGLVLGPTTPLHDLFGVFTQPTILMVNATDRIKLRGISSFSAVRDAIKEFIRGEYEPPIPLYPEFLLPEEYGEEIEGFKGVCVFQTSRVINPFLEKAQVAFKNESVKFFFGEKNLPLSFMKRDGLYVIDPVQAKGLKVEKPQQLIVTINRTLHRKVRLDSFSEL